MKNALIAFASASAILLAAPASAQSFGPFFPNLTFPPKPAAPVTDQSCIDMTKLNDATCQTQEK
ncbi:hypothetical protein [Loktanella sp. S4079]|uniref:hypothetical protein n=1 Tax=Loktanella sp. S4079 TaxID=579483 RepID=UPI0005F9CE0E|nr:hypothetical protein [Loktanella sp. S4079]KJZ18048.1 hypothetical protein TW80_16295 [Loktanella sp. S4079]